MMNSEQLDAVPYRRILSTEESESIWRQLSSRWGIEDNYWYPLTGIEPDAVEAFQDVHFDKQIGTKKLRSILASRKVGIVWEIREDDNNYEPELSVFDPYYNGAEGYWCDSTFEWIIYASHESSITIGGWLLPEVQKAWPNWKDHVWTTPFFD